MKTALQIKLITPTAQCKDKSAATTFCAFEQSYDGCKADASKQRKFAYAECPVEGRQINMRECLEPHFLIGESGEGGGGTVRTTDAECAQRYQSRARGW
jgi:uncharacterized protein (DUF2126 family)